MKKLGKRLLKSLASTFLGGIVILGGYYLLLMLLNGSNGDQGDKGGSKDSSTNNGDKDRSKDDGPLSARYRVDGISKRQNEILSMIESLGRVSISDLESSFKGFSSRTLRRDLDQLQDEGLIVQKGRTRSTVYEIA